MDGRGAKSLSALGFLTVVENTQHGLFGGYLVLNPSGHPIEFHCTAPVKPNKAQQILYGPTLEPYLYGQQIGQTLLSKSRRKPPVVLTDVPQVLALRDYSSTPVVFVSPTVDYTVDPSTHDQAVTKPPPGPTPETPAGGENDGDNGDPADASGAVYRLDAAHPGGPKSAMVRIGAHELALPIGADDSSDQLVKQLENIAKRVDLAEPFERIREAIQEAQRIGN